MMYPLFGLHSAKAEQKFTKQFAEEALLMTQQHSAQVKEHHSAAQKKKQRQQMRAFEVRTIV